MQLSKRQDSAIHVLVLELVREYPGRDCSCHGVGDAIDIDPEYAVSSRPELVVECIDTPYQRLLILIGCADSEEQCSAIFDEVATECEALC